jgi:predicted TIM-barrel fold metal-dependent hydrolase
MHCHVFSPEYREIVDERPPPPYTDLLARMDRWGIDAAVLSSGGPLRGPKTQAELARINNEGYAELVRQHPTRFGAIANVPLPDVDAAIAELEYALDTLELDGVLLMSNYDGVYLGDPRLDPFFDALEERGAYCFVHPDFPPSSPLPHHPGRWYEFPFDTTRALVNVALNGTLDRCPNVRMQWAHLGGTIPFIANRIHNQSWVMPDERTDMQHGMSHYFAKQWYDTGLSAYYGNVLTSMGIAPIEQLVFGTDFPYTPLPQAGDDLQPELAMIGHARTKIDGENAAVLVPRLYDRVTSAAA